MENKEYLQRKLSGLREQLAEAFNIMQAQPEAHDATYTYYQRKYDRIANQIADIEAKLAG